MTREIIAKPFPPRDPRQDPQVGDVLKHFGNIRVRATVDEVVGFTEDEADQPEWVVIETWRKRMQHADIVELAGCGKLETTE